jgi:hypothetical protein
MINSTELNITAAMVDAGASALERYSPDFETFREAAVKIYVAMELARQDRSETFAASDSRHQCPSPTSGDLLS